MEREKLQKSYNEIGINAIVTDGTYMTTIPYFQMVNRKTNTQLQNNFFIFFLLHPTLATLLVFFPLHNAIGLAFFAHIPIPEKNTHTHTHNVND